MNSKLYLSFFVLVSGFFCIQAVDDAVLNFLNRGVAIGRAARGAKRDKSLRIELQKKRAEEMRKEEKRTKKIAQKEAERKMAILRKMR